MNRRRSSLCRRPLIRAARAIGMVGTFSFLAAGCGDDTAGTTDGDGGAGGKNPDGPTPEECVPSKADGAIVTTCGVFVDGKDGDDKAEGTAPAPFRTIKYALDNAKGRPIYVCRTAEAYTENIEITEDAEIYGGLGCSDWKYTAKQTELRGVGDDVIPLRLTANIDVLIEDFSIVAADATAPGASSISTWTAQATAAFRRVSFEAGAGVAGVDAALPDEAVAGVDGNNGAYGCNGGAGSLPGGATADQLCGTVATNGGKGGDGYFQAPNILLGTPAEVGLPGELRGGGVGAGGNTCAPGKAGTGGMLGADGLGAVGIGALTESGFVSVPGTAGEPGTPGQGGGGGGHLNSGTCPSGLNGTPPSSGSGGSGGCGGPAGSPGSGAGSSLAFVSIDSDIVFEDCSFTTANGGTGGLGQGGSAGGLGGLPGAGGLHPATTPIPPNPPPKNHGCAGGEGGDGGPGGAGGGGLGGHSIAIAFVGTTPTERGSNEFDLGPAGEGGDSPGNAGEDGVRSERLDFSPVAAE